MTSPRHVIVHDLAQARAAATAAAESGRPVVLESPPAGADSLGPLLFARIVAQAAAEHPRAALEALIDCADSPGRALAALRQGFKRVRVRAGAEALDRLQGIAAQSGAFVETAAAPALDLAEVEDPLAACRDWLARD